MLRRIKHMAAVACALSFAAGCTVQLNPEENTGKPVAFSAGTVLMQDDATKADSYYDDASFGVFVFRQSTGVWNDGHRKPDFMFNQMVHCFYGTYSYTPIKYWPGPTSGTLTFWAYSPYDAGAELMVRGNNASEYTNDTEGLPDIRFTVNGHTDILYSDVLANQTYTSNSGTADLTFNHALSLIDVKAEKVDMPGTYTVTLRKISFKGLYAKAVLTSPDEGENWNWTGHQGQRQELIVWNDNPGSDSDDIVLLHGTPSNVSNVMPLPQNLGDDACRLSVEYDISYYEDPTDDTSRVEFSATREVYLRDVFYDAGTSVWEMNAHYYLTIKIYPDKPIQFTVSWSDWGAEHNYQLSS